MMFTFVRVPLLSSYPENISDSWNKQGYIEVKMRWTSMHRIRAYAPCLIQTESTSVNPFLERDACLYDSYWRHCVAATQHRAIRIDSQLSKHTHRVLLYEQRRCICTCPCDTHASTAFTRRTHWIWKPVSRFAMLKLHSETHDNI